jgi:predicted transport protein/predicted type IV restriction endonuclease
MDAKTKSAIMDAKKIIEDVQKMDGNEASTRMRVERIFENVMGYDVFKHLSREHAVHGVGDTEHMDWAIKIIPDKISVVVELKRVNIDLNKKHLKQATRYAIDIGCEWVVLTNARRWELYHVEFGQPPETKLINSWNLLQDDIESLTKKFEMISFKSVKKGMLDKLWEKQSALTPECILSIILSEDFLRKMRSSIKKDSGVTVHPEDIVGAFRKLLNDNASKIMEQMKISLPERRRKKSSPKEGMNYTIDDHLRNASPKTKNIFDVVNQKITSLNKLIIVEPKAKYIAYKLRKNFVDIVVKQDGLKIFLNVPSGMLKDPYGLARDLTKPKKIGHWGNGDYEVILESEQSIDKVFELIKQSYTFNQ